MAATAHVLDTTGLMQFLRLSDDGWSRLTRWARLQDAPPLEPARSRPGWIVRDGNALWDAARALRNWDPGPAPRCRTRLPGDDSAYMAAAERWSARLPPALTAGAKRDDTPAARAKRARSAALADYFKRTRLHTTPPG